MKKITSLVLVLTLALGLFFVSFGNIALAKGNDDEYALSGKDLRFIKVLDKTSDLPDYSVKSHGAIDSAPWKSFSNDYFYKQMKDNQKKFYDALKVAVDDFFYNEKNGVKIQTNAGPAYVIRNEGIPFEDMSATEAGDLYLIFQNSNPQYYFLENSRITTSRGSGGMFYPSLYSDYVNASDRRESNKQFLSIVNSYISEVKNYSNDKVERQKRIHTLLAEKLTYASEDKADWPPHQSAATAVLTGVTVCAGYSELYALLCNAVGIPCICVTSLSHEWNMVQYGDYWYNVDLTNDDSGISPRWKYFNVPNSDSFYKGHVPEAIYTTLKLPEAKYNFGDKPLEEVIKKGSVFRLYDKNSGEHFFTTDKGERDSCIRDGWDYEKIAFISYTDDKSIPVYRLYNPTTGEHYYTVNAGERNILVNKYGWNYEKIAFYSDPNKAKPVYIMFNPNSTDAGSHHYTKRLAEVNYLINQGWEYHKIGWYAVG